MNKKILIGIISILIIFISGCSKKEENLTPVEKDKALHSAVVLGKESEVLKLIQQGANVDYINETVKMTSIMHLITVENYTLAKKLIEKSKNIDFKDERGDTALMYVLQRTTENNDSTLEIVNLLIEKGANINVINKNKHTPLILAVMSENKEMVKLLVEKGADINYVSHDGVNSLSLAENGKNSEIKNYLISKGGKNPPKVAVKNTQSNTNVKKTKENLEVIEHHCENGNITGKIKNNTSFTYKYVEVNINLYDGNGDQVGHTMTNVTNLESDKTWKFSAVFIEKNVKSYKIVKIYGY